MTAQPDEPEPEDAPPGKGGRFAVATHGCAPAGLLDTYHDERHVAGARTGTTISRCLSAKPDLRARCETKRN